MMDFIRDTVVIASTLAVAGAVGWFIHPYMGGFVLMSIIMCCGGYDG